MTSFASIYSNSLREFALKGSLLKCWKMEFCTNMGDNSGFYALVYLHARNNKNPTIFMLQQKEVKKGSKNRSSFSKYSSTCF